MSDRGDAASGESSAVDTLARLQLAALDAVANAVVFTDRRGTILWVNAAWQKMTGYSPDEVLGRNPRILKSGHQSKEFYADLWRTILAGRVWRGELVNKRKDGSLYTEEETITPLLDESGAVTHFIAVKHDISDRKLAEMALRESEERARRAAAELAKVLEFSLDVICTVDEAGRFAQMSPASAELWGYSPAELVGIPYSELLPEEDRPPSSAVAAEVMSGKTIRTFQNRYRRKDGRLVDMMWSAAWSPTDRKIFAIGRDVTELERMRRAVHEHTLELEAAKERAEAADRLKSAFLATMSHELRTPLNSVIGFTGILLQELPGPLNAEQKKQLEMVRGSARHLLALINDVLDLSKIEAGQLEVRREPFELDASLARVAASVRPSAENKGLTLELNAPPVAGHVVGDQRRVEQVLLNLLSNAIKFTEQGQVTLDVTLVGGAVLMTVSDTGMGIKPDDLATLFQPFRQLDTGLSRNYEGTGLGLAICRRLAALMGGEVRAESVWGRGSAFTFSLPKEPPA